MKARRVLIPIIILAWFFSFQCRGIAADLSAGVWHGKGQFIIANKDAFDWRDCSAELNDEYNAVVPMIAAYGFFTVPDGDFAKRNGERFNPVRVKPLRFFIRCRITPHGTMSTLVGWR